MYQELHDVRRELASQEGGMFEITEIEVRGQKLKAYKNAPANLRDIWMMAGAGYAARPYLIYNDESWTYAEAYAESIGLANWVLAQGVKPGERVALALRNYPEWMICYWGLVSIGVAVVGMNAWWTSDEMNYGLEDSAAKILICDQERLDNFLPIKQNFPDMKLVGIRLAHEVEGVTPYESLKAESPDMPDIAVDGDDDACIFYTSGTTGRPKGAQLTHRGCVANILNMAFMTGSTMRALARVAGTEDELPDPLSAPPATALMTTPLFHVTANNCGVMPITVTGGALVHMYRWDAGEALKLIDQHKVTNMSGVPVMAREVLQHPDFDKYDTSSLQTLGGGGAQLQPDLVGKINKALANGSATTGYGMTETCGIISAITGAYFEDRPESCGLLVPTMDGKCVDADGNDLAIGEVGELCVRGSNVIKGYLNREEATAETIADGWLHTGDIARIDEQGFIYIVDRAKDMVLRGGENIYCSEVESAIFKHDAVAECAVFSVPDDRLGEEVGAAIVIAAGKEISAEDIRAHCAPLIAKFKIPRYIWLRHEALPRNASGKFLKRELRDTLDIAAAE